MGKAINVVFLALVGALVFSAIAFQVADRLVPSFEAPKSSSVEGRKYVQFEDVVEKSVVDGEFQDSFEQYAADSVPLKESLVALSAALQRQGIVTANIPFGYRVYPTFFSSEYCAVPEDGLLVSLPARAPGSGSSTARHIDDWTATLSHSAENHPDVRFLVNVSLQVRQDDSDPTYDHVSSYKKIDAGWVRAAWDKGLDDSIDFVVDDVAGYDEVRDGWFATDHHWKLEHALSSYNKIADEMGLRHVEWDDAPAVEAVPSWRGSHARRGLDFDYTDSIVDQAYDFSELSYKSYNEQGVGKEIENGKREAVLAGEFDARRMSLDDAYSDYYGNKPAVVENAGPNNGRTCLLVGDSLSYVLRRYIAFNYKRTVCVHPGNGKVDRTLDSFIDEFDADDVIVLTHALSPDFIAQQSPKFLKGE